MRTLYFDIYGVLLGYDDRPKSRLRGGILPDILDASGFSVLVCVSSWTDMVSEALRIEWVRPEAFADELMKGVHDRIAEVFPDFNWFARRVVLVRGNDHRARHIDLSSDWYYCDDWADKFFSEVHSKEIYCAHLGKRIHLADAHDDGSGLLEWLAHDINAS